MVSTSHIAARIVSQFGDFVVARIDVQRRQCANLDKMKISLKISTFLLFTKISPDRSDRNRMLEENCRLNPKIPIPVDSEKEDCLKFQIL